MATVTEADVSHLVESAFDECGSTNNDVEHQGKIAALWVGHTCATYLMCEAHFKRAIDVHIPRHNLKIAQIGHITCALCDRKFLTAEEFVKVYPL
ncbi:Uncharacterised protein [Mycobacteroides abscessus subsp. massiliense]|uniref:hypothetical protein n=1 Tax=Mycobacteroides abscessus TaxID=36809 RepID=UPI0009A78463|nr:hypothetical protein [Mycobacteroides abscessus]SKU88416.1 Uncharacterised protein [Mycobacteroides abscessus subsp. massiliense]SKU96501.1 Uncharacterised protein [Mycobacteroides abscessus subsp. massiliense]